MTDQTIYGKVQPQAIDLEEAVLGAILLDLKAFQEVEQILNEKCFYLERNRKVYLACKSLYLNGFPIDMLTVVEQLTKLGEIEEVGGIFAISELTNKVASSANLEYHARVLFEKYIKRELIVLGNELIKISFDGNSDAFEVTDIFQLKLAKLTENIKTQSVKKINEVAYDAILEMKENSIIKSELVGISTTLTKLDKITSGFYDSGLFVIGAGAGEGKSTLALQLTERASLTKNVLFFALEMSSVQLAWKLFSTHLNIPIKKLIKGDLSEAQWNKLNGEVYQEIQDKKLYIYDEGGLSIFSLISICRNMKAKGQLDLVVVDYLQLLNASGGDFKHGIREQEISFISKKLKSLAKELNIPVVALSQLSRIDKSQNRLYRLSDLRESGAIEQDADGVIMIYRPSYHNVQEMSIGGSVVQFEANDAIIQIEKWRLGETGICMVKFDGGNSKFEDESTFLDEYVPIGGAF